MKNQSLLPGIVMTERPEPPREAFPQQPAPAAEAEQPRPGHSGGRSGNRSGGRSGAMTGAPSEAQSEALSESQSDGWPPMSEMLHSLFVFEPTTPAPAPITVLGLDCGTERGLAHLSPEQRALLEQATVICGGKGLLAAFAPADATAEKPHSPADSVSAAAAPEDRPEAPAPDSDSEGKATAATAAGTPPAAGTDAATEAVASPEQTVSPATEEPVLKARFLPLSLPLEPWLSRLSHMRAAGERVLLLADGDPLFFGIGATLVRQLGAQCVRLVPAVTSLQQACARLALPWHKVITLSLHGRDDLAPLNAAVSREAPLCILTDARMTPDVLARHLLDRGVDWFRAHIFEYMGSAQEKSHDLSLAETAGRTFGPVCTLILLPADTPRRPRLGLNTEELAVEGSLITKKPVRAAALSLLQIGPRHVVWDIGAGSGAVSLEACVLAHEGRVIAVERSAGRAMSIQENRRRFAAATLDVCLGQAPECLPSLPDPQRVFIGGGLSGDDAADILGHICHRLTPGGRLVASCVLLDSLGFCRHYLEELGWPVEMQMVQAAEARQLADDLHFVGLNPVFLLAAQKPVEPV